MFCAKMSTFTVNRMPDTMSLSIKRHCMLSTHCPQVESFRIAERPVSQTRHPEMRVISFPRAIKVNLGKSAGRIALTIAS